MLTIRTIQSKMKEFNTFARTQANTRTPELELQAKWKGLFDTNLPINSAKSFVKHYRNMRTNNAHQSGGTYSLASAAGLDYRMVPGLNTESYGKFPVAVNTDTQSIQDLDVYFQNSLTKNCGVENSSLTIPEGMGYNAVGGSKNDRKNSRKSRNNRMNRKNNRNNTERKNASRQLKSTRRNNSQRKNNTRRQHGGIASPLNFGTAMYWRPYSPSAPDNYLQQVGDNSYGHTYQIPSSNPSSAAWGYISSGTKGLLNPGNITNLNDNFNTLASPVPYQGANASGQAAVAASSAAMRSATGTSAVGITALHGGNRRRR